MNGRNSIVVSRPNSNGVTSSVVAADGEQVTLFGGRGADGALYVCAVDERHAGS